MMNEIWVIYYTDSDYSSSTDYQVGFCTSESSAEITCHMLNRIHEVMQETVFENSDINKEFLKQIEAKKTIYTKALTRIDHEFPKGMPNRQAKITAYTARVREEIFGEIDRALVDAKTMYDHQQKVIDYFDADDYTSLIKITFERKNTGDWFVYSDNHCYIKLPNMSGD